MTDADFTYQLIIAGSGVANAILVWRHFFGKAEKRQIQDPLNVREADRFVTEKEIKPLKERVDGHDEAIAEIRKDAQANFNAVMKSDAEGRSRLHKEISIVALDVASIKDTVEPLKNLPERIARDIGIIK